jgi:VWFA-related protein
VEVVRLDVSVLGRNRQPIRGLTAADFTVFENGQPQPIVAFSPVDIPDVVAPPAAWMRDVGSDVATNTLDTRRVVVILMDDGMTESDPGTAKTAKTIARSVIDRLGPNDLGAVVFTFAGRSQNFTTDHSRLIAAAETFIPKFNAAPSPMSAAAGAKGAFNPGAAGIPLGCRYRGTRNCLTEALKNAAAALQNSAPGRKTLVLVSSGIPYDFSMENLELADDLDDLRVTFEHLQRANVNVYPFDPTGLTAAGIIAARLDSLRIFAESTGGRSVLGTNAPWDHVSQVFAENSSYYLVGFQPLSSVKDGRFRRITVKVNRPDADVRARSGYYAERAERRSGKPPENVTGLETALRSGLPTGDLPLEISVAPFAVPSDKKAVVTIAIGIQRPGSTTASVEALEVLSTAFDKDFKERAATRQTMRVTLPPSGMARRLEMRSRLMLPPGRYEIRVAAEGPSGAGGVYTDVDVPDFSKTELILSGLVFGRLRSEISGGSEMLADVLPIVPTVRRNFLATEPMKAFLRVYQPGKTPSPIDVSARIVNGRSAMVVEDTRSIEADAFKANRSADYQLDLPLARLTAGEYLLTVEASRDKQRTSRSVRFQVN